MVPEKMIPISAFIAARFASYLMSAQNYPQSPIVDNILSDKMNHSVTNNRVKKEMPWSQKSVNMD